MTCTYCGRTKPCGQPNCPGADDDDEYVPLWDDKEEFEKDQLLGEE